LGVAVPGAGRGAGGLHFLPFVRLQVESTDGVGLVLEVLDAAEDEDLVVGDGQRESLRPDQPFVLLPRQPDPPILLPRCAFRTRTTARTHAPPHTHHTRQLRISIR
jgi:hypothetical protein